MRKTGLNRAVLAYAVALVCIPALLPAQNRTAPVGGERLLQVETKQALLRAQTLEAAQDLDRIIAEFQANGLGQSADVKTLLAIRQVLAQMSQRDMQRVVELLQAVRQASVATTQATANQAYAVQKNINLQFRQLLLEFNRQREYAELAQRFDAQAQRQHLIMYNGRKTIWRLGMSDLARMKNSNYEVRRDAMRSAIQMASTDQNALRDEVNLVMAQLQEFAKLAKTAGGDTKLDQIQKHMSESSLTGLLRTASEDVSTGNLGKAMESQRKVRDELRQLSLMAAPTRTTLEQVRLVVQAMTPIVQQQETLAGQWPEKKVFGKDEKGRETDQAELQDLLDQNADQIDALVYTRQQLGALVPLANSLMTEALTVAQEVNRLAGRPDTGLVRREMALLNKSVTQTLYYQRQVVTLLQAVIERLQEAQQPAAMLARLEALQKEVAQLQQQQDMIIPLRDTLTSKDTVENLVKAQGQLAVDTTPPQTTAQTLVPLAAQELQTAITLSLIHI